MNVINVKRLRFCLFFFFVVVCAFEPCLVSFILLNKMKKSKSLLDFGSFVINKKKKKIHKIKIKSNELSELGNDAN